MTYNLNRYLIDFVKQVDAGHVDAISFDDVDQVFGRSIVPQRDVGVMYLVLAENRTHGLLIQLRLRHLGSNKRFNDT